MTGDPLWIDARHVAGLVSVVIPTFNRSAMLAELLDALLAQCWRPLEIIIVDDGSQDDTMAMLHRRPPLPEGVTMRVLQQANAGPASARNAGLRFARGEYLFLIDSDDLIQPGAISTLAGALRGSKAPYALAPIRSVDASGAAVVARLEGIPRQVPENIISSHWMTHSALYRREALRRAGPYNETLRTGEDTELQWRVIAVNGPGVMIDTVLGTRRLHGGAQLSTGLSQQDKGRGGLAAISAFVRWAKVSGVMTPGIAAGVVRYAIITGIRLGACGDWSGKRAARALIAGVSGHGVRGAKLAKLIGGPDVRLLFQALLGLYYLARAARLGLALSRGAHHGMRRSGWLRPLARRPLQVHGS
ncbi:MAG: glycosyltransferase family A protein [Blastomonas sp.]